MNEKLEGTLRYIGTKILDAKPMTRGKYNEFRGWAIPADEDPDEAGYIVQYKDSYISWSPAPQFEEVYAEMLMKTEVERETLNFASALTYAKKSGAYIARAGWNGKGMWVRFIDLFNDDQFSVTEEADSIGTWTPFLIMKNTDNKLFPWNATHSDTMAEDWYLLTEEDLAQ